MEYNQETGVLPPSTCVFVQTVVPNAIEVGQVELSSCMLVNQS